MHITAQQFMLALVSACDAFMLGGLKQNSLSAVSLASQITFVFNLILTALTIGENMFVAQYYGKKDFDGLRTSAGLVLKYVLAVSVIFFIATLIVVCLNIVLNAVLIYGYFGFPRMTIAGAALATVIANEIGLVMTIYILHLKKELWVGISDIKKRKINITKNLLICVCTGFGYGGSIIVGNLLGEGNLSEARKSGNTLCKIAVFSGDSDRRYLNITDNING